MKQRRLTFWVGGPQLIMICPKLYYYSTFARIFFLLGQLANKLSNVQTLSIFDHTSGKQKDGYLFILFKIFIKGYQLKHYNNIKEKRQQKKTAIKKKSNKEKQQQNETATKKNSNKKHSKKEKQQQKNSSKQKQLKKETTAKKNSNKKKTAAKKNSNKATITKKQQERNNDKEEELGN